MEVETLTYVRNSASYAPAIKLNATTARAADILANLVIKYDMTKDLSFVGGRGRRALVRSSRVPSLLFKAPLLV